MTATARVPFRAPGTGRERTLVTPEGIALPIVVAGRGARFGALLLDLMLIVALIGGSTILLLSIAGGISVPTGTIAVKTRALEFLFIVWIVLLFLFRNAYFLYFELGPRGATPGKRAAGIRIAARDGGRLTAEMVIARNLLRDIELFLPIVLLASLWQEDIGAASLAAALWFLIFAGMPLFNHDALRAGDIIAGTWVIEAPRQRLEAAIGLAKPGAARDAGFIFNDAELQVYGEYELQTLERILRQNRREALVPVHETIARKIGRPVVPGEARAFLDAYYTQLRARLEAGMRMGRRKADKNAA